jgi:hypothetical protein
MFLLNITALAIYIHLTDQTAEGFFVFSESWIGPALSIYMIILLIGDITRI